MSNGLDPDLAAALGEIEGDQANDDGEEAFEEEVELAPRVEVPRISTPPVAVPPGVRTRKRRGAVAPKSGSTTYAGAPGVTPTEPGEKLRISNDGTKNLSTIWTETVQRLLEMGFGPDVVWIRVKRYAIGPQRTAVNAAQDMTPIDGASVGGSDRVAAGEDLVSYITDVYHFTAVPQGPARYVCNIAFKSGHGNNVSAPEGELILGDPREIKAQREAAQAALRRREMERGPIGYSSYVAPHAPQMAPYRGPVPGFQSPVQAPPAVAPMPVAVPQFIGASPELEQMRRDMEVRAQEIARQTGIYEERARAEGVLAARPAPVVGPVESPAEAEARLVGAVVKALAVSGLLPQAPAAPPPANFTGPAVASAVTDPMDVMENFLKQMTRFDAMRDRMREMVAPEEDDEPIPPPAPMPQLSAPVPTPNVEGTVEADPYAFKEVGWATPLTGGLPLKNRKKDPAEGMAEYIIDLGMNNPELALKMGEKLLNGPLGAAVGKLLENTAVGKVLAANAQQKAIEMPTAALNGANGHAVPTPPVGSPFGGSSKPSSFVPKG